MAAKYYRAKKDSFLWDKGAILKERSEDEGYRPIEDVWDATEHNENEYISSRIIENSPQWFERVYASNLEKMIFKTKAELKKALSNFKS